MTRTIAIALMMTAGTPALAQTAAPAVKTTYIHAGALLARAGQPPRANSTIIVRDGKVAEVRDGFVAPEAGAELIELKDKFVLPGLIDLHVHLLGIGGDPMRARLTALNTEQADDVMYGAGNARATLRAGFTTVRDLGGEPRSIRALRDAVERGDIEGPTIVNAGTAISVTGGHGDPLNGLAEPYAHAVAATVENTCDGPSDCVRATRRQIGLGAQVVKITATGGVLSNVSGGLGRAFTPEEMRAIVETAHGLGRKVAAHSHAAEGTKAALNAGVDTIEHGSFIDDETIALFKKTGAYLVPTEIAPVAALAQARAGALPPAVIPKAEAAAAAMQESHRRAYKAGVKFAFGTDSGVSKHGENGTEFALLVDKVGMSPTEAIRSATLTAAEVLGQGNTIGSIEPGKTADIIAVDASPLGDVRELERVRFVMHRGAVAKRLGE
ncbi:metal-dependent hydrolase family protein [Sphingomonas radiodurans]|uniref:metal-dependent hydrolase family protein n=1 Tax=Sphingomonas radiodurans TaxID=2890321 RepID=UPI001E480DA6|nr:amidohydrolase family protein [Sphingomonas radiodurans]WBH17352.1 amidohydrolase family protein [Sphingomonas radiodurans]